MEWEIEYTVEEQESIATSVGLLEKLGPNLPRPHSDTVKGSVHSNMKELRTQHAGEPFRTLYAFDPRRKAILLIEGTSRAIRTGIKRLSQLLTDYSPNI